MKIVKWLLGTFLIDPLIMLFIWNVLAVPMFSVGKTTFVICAVISFFINIFYTGLKSSMD